jgi:hypothetical protein
VKSHPAGTETERCYRDFESRPKLEVERLVAGSGKRQKVKTEPAHVLGLERALATPAAYASVSPSQWPAFARRLAAAPVLDEMIGCGCGLDEASATVTASCQCERSTSSKQKQVARQLWCWLGQR